MIQVMQRGNEPHSGTAYICIILQRFLAHTIQDFRNGPGYLSGFVFNTAGIVPGTYGGSCRKLNMIKEAIREPGGMSVEEFFLLSTKRCRSVNKTGGVFYVYIIFIFLFYKLLPMRVLKAELLRAEQ